MVDAAEAIAEVVADLRAGRCHPADPSDTGRQVHELAKSLVVAPTVVDATAIYQGLRERSDGVALYEDHPCIAPPWDEAAICYQNRHGNVYVMHATVVPDGVDLMPWEPAEEVDRSRLRWRIDTFAWVGGRSTDREGTVPLAGPAHLLQFAVYDDGSPADLHWVQLLPDQPLGYWDMPQLVLLGTLNFMACRNVELVEPSRPRAQRRRIERTGVTVKTINVFPVGSSTRSRASGERGVPLTPVRGHFAHYGEEYGRGLLFGKYSGRFWIAQHARGDAELGRTQASYRLRDPDS